MTAIKILNLRILPYEQKDEISKIVFGDEWTITIKLPTPHQTGDKYAIGIDYENTLYPPNRPLCAGTEAFVLDGENLTFAVKLGTARLRDWLSTLKKPTPIAIQIVRVRNNRAETLLLDTILALPSVFDGVVTVCEGDAIQLLLDAKLDKPAIDGTPGQILSINADGQLVWRDEQEIPEQEQADWTESDSDAKSYIRNKPDLSIYVEKEEGKGLSTNDFTDADKAKLGGIEDGAEVNVQGDWDVSDSSNDAYIRNKPVISTVGHTGSYSDLLDKPDLSVYSLITETGNKISMSIDEEYDLVVSLLDKNDNLLSTQDIDLPIESMIVDASYSNGVLTLTLQNGNTVDVDISDIVSGLVPDSRTVNGHSLSSDVTITASDLGLATVATTGDYDDLVNKPVIGESASKNYLTFERTNNYTVYKVRLDKIGNPQDIDLEYSIDSGSTWTKYTWSGTTGYEISGIYSVMFRGNNNTICQSSSNGYRFILTGNIASSARFVAYGDVMSLLDTTGTLKDVKSYCFQGLFKDCSCLIQAPRISATRYEGASCQEMFKGCTNLKYIPKIHADFANGSAFYEMFRGCTSLESADVDVGYALERALYGMFYGCTSLRALEFKAFRVKRFACMTMCSGCTSLESVVLSLGDSIDNQNYDNMFSSCTNLKHVVLDAQTFPSNTGNWLDGVSSSGVFRCYKGVTIPSRNSSGVPSAWTVEYVDYLTEQQQADWAQTNATDTSYVKNRNTSTVATSSDATYEIAPGLATTPAITVSSALTLSASASASTQIAYTEVVLDIDANATVTAGTNLTLVDTLTAGKRNVCVVRWSGGTAKLYVVIVEDLDESSSN